MLLDCAGKTLDLSKPRVMGILNVTPDSFSDGGSFLSAEDALARAKAMVDEGADIIDVGGESTRPGAQPVVEQEELDRVIPIIEGIASELAVPVSIDTSKAGVMREAVAAGAGMINDVMALREESSLEVAAQAGVPVCLMHMLGEPRTMQNDPQYSDVVDDIKTFLEERVQACRAAGIMAERLLLDPGFGFGKTLEHNQRLLADLDQLADIGLPLLIGISRKSMIGALLNDAPMDQRLYGGLAAAVLAAERGAAILRVHDVKPTADALKVTSAVMGL
ncbi:dihydropteroate synthase [Solemya velesiana gill symbiont]|uniref:Dihydropteroate synthase n=1 Tax=Solemya velesiana gill symbiont TaxID=1918948 RepID=A0A1T2KSG2_9GAMM|nr:dihydropteroate synthase [Solemya velesiana gill symbiont]OOZ35809.1 dihydropteroate synthase [Solemya velesiana gill symbiont]